MPELGLQAATESTFLHLQGESHSGLIINLEGEGRRYYFIDGVVFVQAQIPVYLSCCDASSHWCSMLRFNNSLGTVKNVDIQFYSFFFGHWWTTSVTRSFTSSTLCLSSVTVYIRQDKCLLSFIYQFAKQRVGSLASSSDDQFLNWDEITDFNIFDKFWSTAVIPLRDTHR